jgi:pilus assembly protein Flp/PilA
VPDGDAEVGKARLDFVGAEEGPTPVEYAVIMALIIVACLIAITALGTNANQTLTTVSNSVAGGS